MYGFALAAIGSITCAIIVREYLQLLFVTVIKAVPIEFAFNIAELPDAEISTTEGLLVDHEYPSTIGESAFFTFTDTVFVLPSPIETTFELVVRYVNPASSSSLFPTTTRTCLLISVAVLVIVI